MVQSLWKTVRHLLKKMKKRNDRIVLGFFRDKEQIGLLGETEQQDIYYEELAQVVIEVMKSQDLLSASQRHMKASGVIQ